jgi:S-(hydroxymethyl)glutathione dehydrogenase/alcohol dehydrogenase
MLSKAAILHTVGEPLDVVDISIPLLQEGQYLVKISYTSICGSQLNEIYGLKGVDRYLPHLLGHEAVGSIVDKHNSSEKLSVGDNVICSWIVGDGLDGGPVKYGKYNAGPIATFTELAIISENRLYKIDQEPCPEHSMLGCALPTAIGAANKLDVDGKRILIAGVGAVGLGIAIYLSEQCSTLVKDLDSDKIQTAEKYGARYNNEKVDVVFDCTGSIDSLNQVMKCINDGTLVVVGNPKHGEFMRINPYDFIFGKKIVGHNGNDINMDDFINNISELDLDPYKDIIGNQFDLENINSAITATKKPIIVC